MTYYKLTSETKLMLVLENINYKYDRNILTTKSNSILKILL